MTELLRDIQREPFELLSILDFAFGPGQAALKEGARLLAGDRHIYVTGVGSSWHAALAVGSVFDAGGQTCRVIDASELLHTPLPAHSSIVVLSRSGRSYEVVALIAKAKEAGACIIAITNSVDSPLANASDAVLEVRARPDHLVSISMYAGLALIGGLLATRLKGGPDTELRRALEAGCLAAADSLDHWQAQLRTGAWLAPDAPVYFLGRQGSVATCHEARLLWEEAAKAPASALTTGGFRHGSQEIVRQGLRLAIWIQPEFQRDADLRLASEAAAIGAEILVIGHGLPHDAASLVIQIPPLPAAWQFLVDIIPAQVAAEQLAHLRGENCDAFRYCPYIIEQQAGLTGRIGAAECGTNVSR
ncbi:MAG TPA: SIS domain-containing protein [Bryobacteraceae bacterium]|nr:SIS domain-containing protein [Bryobacteraceae bacterium]